MAYEFRLQDPGEGIHEAEILEIVVAEGDHVEEGDDVLVAETDKAAVDIPSPVTGEVIEIKVGEGDLVRVGDVLMVFEEEGAAKERPEAEEAPGERAVDEAEPAESEAGKGVREPAPRAEARRAAPDAGEPGEAPDTAGEEKASAPEREGVRATPAVRGLARELGVDLEALAGGGPEGRVTEEDVRGAAPGAARVRRETLRSIRRATARRMTRSWREIPHVVHHDAVEITALERLRRAQAADVEAEGGKLTLTPFLLKALASALGDHPRFNATFDGERDALEIHPDVHIGVALDTERGLVVPVVRDVRRKSVLALAVELEDLAGALRGGQGEGEIFKGGTFTLTNVGAIGGTGFSPLINPPQVAIFGAARAQLRQVVRGDLDDHELDIALVLPVCVAFDHRVVDGADAARFMNTVRELLSDPGALVVRGS